MKAIQLVQATIATTSIMPFMYGKLPYDALQDFAPVSITTLNPLVLPLQVTSKPGSCALSP